MFGYTTKFKLFGSFLVCCSLIGLGSAALAGVAQTSFVCKGSFHGAYFEVRVNDELDDRITLWSGVPLRRYSYQVLSEYWDANGTGLLSAIDCFITYENDHGCIRNVEITGSFLDQLETVSFDNCGGYHQGCA
ncbi:MAG: hypothetical protein AB8G05_26725 [Oligoflexales bacterium]